LETKIKNMAGLHYEVIESVIVKCRDLLRLSKDLYVNIFLWIYTDVSFMKYINTKIPIL